MTTGTKPANRLWYLDLAGLPVDPETGALQLEGAADKVGVISYMHVTDCCTAISL